MIIDQLVRPLKDLRLSVTDRCNFRCRYCMPEEIFGPDFPFIDKNMLLQPDEMERFVQIFAELGVNKIRITGGEPLLRAELPEIIERIGNIPEIKNIALTTNGSLLKKRASTLKQAGLHRVTVSLDSLDDQRLAQLSGRDISAKMILEGIDEATKMGLPVKINMVVQKSVNEQDILPMARHFFHTDHVLRFIEYMDVGNANGWNRRQVVTSQSIIEKINQVMPIEPLPPQTFGEVATRYRYTGTEREVGFISSVSQAFCGSCTRARLSAEGKLYTCLFSSKGYDLLSPLRRGASNGELKQMIIDIWENRHDQYSQERGLRKQGQPKVEMHHIGG